MKNWLFQVEHGGICNTQDTIKVRVIINDENVSKRSPKIQIG